MGTATKWTGLNGKELENLPPQSIERADPERYKAIIRMLQEGMSIKGTAYAAGCSTRTVYRIMAQDESLQKGVTVLSNKLMRSAHHALDRIQEILEDPDAGKGVEVKELAVFIGVVTDKICRLQSSQVPNFQNNLQVNMGDGQNLNDILASLSSTKPKG